MSALAAEAFDRRLAGNIRARIGQSPTTAGAFPSVSVLMPIYNAERYLEEALESVFGQSWTDYEIVVVDDGSTDRSATILARFAARQPALRIIRRPNGGISAALNDGLATARGEFIARMDGDDIMAPDRLKRQVGFLRTHPEVGFCASYMDMIDEHGRRFDSYSPKPRDLAELRAMLAAEATITFTHPTVMARRSLLAESGGYDPRFEPCEDTELFARLIAKGHPGLVVPETLLSYRVHAASISGTKAVRQIEMVDLVMRNLQARLEGGTPALPASLDDYRRRLPPVRRLLHAARIRSAAWRQMSTYDRAAGRRWMAKVRIAAAAAIEPHRLPDRILSRAFTLLRGRTP